MVETMLKPLPLLALLVSGSAFAQSYERADIVRGLCRKDGCDEFSILDKQPVSRTDQGILYRTRVKTYHASNRGRVEQGEETGYVFCSSMSPAILAEDAGRNVAFLLAPEAAKEPRENTNFYALYFGLCHGVETGRMAASDWRGVAASFGYDVPLAQSRTVTLARPEEVMTLSP
jgi:hypothetical protein